MALSLELKTYGVACTGIDFYWKVIKALGASGAGFTIRDVWGQTKSGRLDEVRDYLKRLEKGGVVRRVGSARQDKANPAVVFELIKTPAGTPSFGRDGKPLQRAEIQRHMWNAIRGLKRFTKHDLALAASTEERPVGVITAQSYLKHLKRAGYLVIVKKGEPGKPEVYKLSLKMNSGPYPPQILKTKVVFDQNRKQIVGPVDLEEVAP